MSSKEYYTPTFITKLYGFASRNGILEAGSVRSVQLGIAVRLLAEAETLLLSAASRPAPGSTQRFVKLKPAALSSQVKRQGRQNDPGP
jgi:hypothetical protein